ncbi:MAG: pyridoxamine 5'-phosphate oxidase family protein [Desulfovibrionaceae bacterium]|nr:pyridoxamine 5'-phosphate oxidase family protein [Desulfovibrionaceae bacterium]
MRRKELEVTDRSHIKRILQSCPIVHLGYVDEGIPYVVPMNFGLEMDDTSCVFYFHSAKEGRKIDIMRKNPTVCVEASLYRPSQELTQLAHKVRYQSVIGTGTAQFVEDHEEKRKALAAMCRHRGRPDHKRSERLLDRVCVFKVTISEMACKQH